MAVELLKLIFGRTGSVLMGLFITLLIGACGTASLEDQDMESDTISKGVSVPKATTEHRIIQP